jgi:hypothetical protein
MKKPARRTARFPHRVVTTLGDLIVAAYEAAGSGPARLDRAARILTESPLARSMSRHVEFVRT